MLKKILGDLIDKPNHKLPTTDSRDMRVMFGDMHFPSINKEKYDQILVEHQAFNNLFRDMSVRSDFENFLHILGIKSARPLMRITFDTMAEYGKQELSGTK